MKIKKANGKKENLLLYFIIFVFVSLFLFVSWFSAIRAYSGSVQSFDSDAENAFSDNTILSTIIPNKDVSHSKQRDFLQIALKTGTDKVAAYDNMKYECANNRCVCPECEREKCRPWGHFYDTIYNRWLAKYSSDDAERIQFLEIGFYMGYGFESYSQFIPRAETHSIEMACMEQGPLEEGKWPWENAAVNSPNYQKLRDEKRLHCGDASNYEFLHKTWTTEMKRSDAPPLKVVVDDGSHYAEHMTTSLFFWIPRIEPGGILIIEDMLPTAAAWESNKFRTHILPQVIKDLHWCGDPNLKDTRCFPTIQPLLSGVHCEMHICVFLRNDEPSFEPDEAASMMPSNAFSNAQKCLFGPHVNAEPVL